MIFMSDFPVDQHVGLDYHFLSQICPTIASKLDWIHEQVMKYVLIPAPSLSLGDCGDLPRTTHHQNKVSTP